MIQYPGTNSYCPASDKIHCPKCGSESLKDDGGCGTGCCDDYICLGCDYAFRIEWPD